MIYNTDSTIFYCYRKNWMLFSPSGDLGITLVWDNLSILSDVLVWVMKSFSNWSRLTMVGSQMFSEACRMFSEALETFSDILKCSQMIPDVLKMLCSRLFTDDLLYPYNILMTSWEYLRTSWKHLEIILRTSIYRLYVFWVWWVLWFYWAWRRWWFHCVWFLLWV